MWQDSFIIDIKQWFGFFAYSYQKKIAYKNAAFGWVLPGLPGHAQTCLNVSVSDSGC